MIAALAACTACAVIGLAFPLLRPGGVAAAWVLGVAVWAAGGWRAFAALLVFLLLGLAVTFLGYRRKLLAGVAEAEGGRRGAAQVVGKGGVVLILAVACLLWRSALGGTFGLVLVASLAAGAADTWATEIGGLLGRRAFTLVPLREVPPGSAGAVSLAGLAGSALGALTISGAGVALGLLGERWAAPAAVCTVSAIVAALVESLLPRLGVRSPLARNLVVTALAPIIVLGATGAPG